jgi:transcription elongation factor GreA
MSEPTQSSAVWLTQAKYDELKAELEELRGPTRASIVKRVSDARDEGDLKENAGYHAARDELGKIDGRIKQLIDMLERAEVGETPADDGVVEPGMFVTVLLGGLEQKFLLGAREMAGSGTDVDVFSPQSPLGQAINGARKGETVDYEAPNGKQIKVEIVDAVPYVG